MKKQLEVVGNFGLNVSLTNMENIILTIPKRFLENAEEGDIYIIDLKLKKKNDE